MKIAATMMSMDAAHNYTEVAFQPSTFLQNQIARLTPQQPPDFGSRLSSLIGTEPQAIDQADATIEATSDITDEGQEPVQTEQEVLEEMTSSILGHSVSIHSVTKSQSMVVHSGLGIGGMAMGAALNNVSIYHEQESMQFSASGTVQTADGKSITFSLGLEVTRQESIVHASSNRGLPFFIDPLMLNFGQGVSMLGDSFFSFDLDGDGNEEKLSCPGKGCGFLAFDQNEDGVINNGLELFGPSTGYGFGELGEFDLDENLWIDENDPIYDQLSVWMKDEDGNEQLLSLKEAGVGAISIANAGSNFTLKDDQGGVVGQVKSNGIFLTENGEVRSIQEIDLADRGANSSENVQDEPSGPSKELLSSMSDLQEIIKWQHFRLRMLLAKKRSNDIVEQFINRFNSRFNDQLEIS